MNVEYSRQFVKAAYKLTGKYKKSLQHILKEVMQVEDLANLSDCIKMVGSQNSYRIKIGDYRLIFIYRVENQVITFELLLSRSEIYRKEHELNLRKKEKD